jgi:Cu(I)/Ag(I) efflux system membrane fusion protein
MRAGAGDVLFRLADLSIVWALIDVAERDVGALKVGLLTEVKARAHAGRVFTGLVAVVYPQINKETRTARVRIELQNRDFVLLPDMYVDAEISVGEPNEVVAIPDSAVIDSGSRQVVFIDKGDGKFEPREVKLGARGGGYTEVREGLVAGENVVTAATFLVDAESNLNAALKSYNDAGKTP